MSDGAITAIVGGVVAVTGGLGKYLIEHAKLKNYEKENAALKKKLRAAEASNKGLKNY